MRMTCANCHTDVGGEKSKSVAKASMQKRKHPATLDGADVEVEWKCCLDYDNLVCPICLDCFSPPMYQVPAHICEIVIFISAPYVHVDKFIEVVLDRSCNYQELIGKKLILLLFCCCS